MCAYLCDGELGQGKAWNKGGAACQGGVGFFRGSLVRSHASPEVGPPEAKVQQALGPWRQGSRCWLGALDGLMVTSPWCEEPQSPGQTFPSEVFSPAAHQAR